MEGYKMQQDEKQSKDLGVKHNSTIISKLTDAGGP
jgi:hypothetical protein